MNCRICRGTAFRYVLDLGHTPFADDFLTEAQLNQPEVYYPLRVVLCEGCKLMQLTYTASREKLYQNDYPYVSSTTEFGVQHYHSMAESIVRRFGVTPQSLAVDIGSNVGVLAEGFQKLGLRVLGVEPAPAIAATAIARGIPTRNDFFSADIADEIELMHGSASVVTGTNVVAHINDLHDLANGLNRLLDQDGVFVFEAPYLGDLIDRCAYDTIYHEHLSYLSIKPVERLFQEHGMTVFDVEPMTIHGGTLRYYIARKTSVWAQTSVSTKHEDVFYSVLSLNSFERKVKAHRTALKHMLVNLKAKGYRIAAVSAPAKGMTLLNYCGLGRDLIDFVTEKAPLKIGKYTPGTHIPVVPDSELLTKSPDYALLLAWNFADEIMKNLSEYSKQGGKFIVPIPFPTVCEPEQVLERVN